MAVHSGFRVPARGRHAVREAEKRSLGGRMLEVERMSDGSMAERALAAATVLVLRDVARCRAGAPRGLEILLVQRASELAFHGGAWVFPGGRVDREELVAGDELESARRAAVRETREEAGLSFAPAALVPFAHWTTPRGRSRRFAAWFFATRLEEPVDVVVDGGEIRAHRWLSPEAALAAQARGELELPPPTFVTVYLLCAFASAEEALAHFRARAPRVYAPRLVTTPGGELALYQEDAAYHGGELEQPGPRHRLRMGAGAWSYERTPGVD